MRARVHGSENFEACEVYECDVRWEKDENSAKDLTRLSCVAVIKPCRPCIGRICRTFCHVTKIDWWDSRVFFL